MAPHNVEPRKDITKQLYRPVLAVSSVISCVLCFGFYSANPALERTQEITTRQADQVEVVEIPPTQHERQEVAPSRPQVPVEAEDAMEVEDITIEDTELFDEVALAVPAKMDEVIVEEEEPVMELWLVEEQPRVMQQAMPEYPRYCPSGGNGRKRHGDDGGRYRRSRRVRTGHRGPAGFPSGSDRGSASRGLHTRTGRTTAPSA